MVQGAMLVVGMIFIAFFVLTFNPIYLLLGALLVTGAIGLDK